MNFQQHQGVTTRRLCIEAGLTNSDIHSRTSSNLSTTGWNSKARFNASANSASLSPVSTRSCFDSPIPILATRKAKASVKEAVSRLTGDPLGEASCPSLAIKGNKSWLGKDDVGERGERNLDLSPSDLNQTVEKNKNMTVEIALMMDISMRTKKGGQLQKDSYQRWSDAFCFILKDIKVKRAKMF
ncbi:hypothetical protein H5410_043634 [Solanum commersonii]|uniref:Uncharacterized protein n=1 Tax=Solanum commersonii TaxID=4109 RepID=A0A9J5Y0S9_SOLCO|nr:hypothetical protein H5410_043634 [Solanum commersonii]